MTRKTFLGGLATSLVASSAPTFCFGGEKPIFRVGLLTDTHVMDDPETCRLVGKAMSLFRDAGVEVVCHLGDLAHVYSPAGLDEYRRILVDTFGNRMPLTLYAFGGHDRNGYKLKPGETDREAAVFGIERGKLMIPHGLCDTVDYKGYKFVIVQEYFEPERERIAEMVDKAVAACPGRPVFVLEHEPAYRTTGNSVVWGNSSIREICERHPEVVHLSGHSHGSIRDERAIWQGAFTEVNFGCLTWWIAEEANVSTLRNDWQGRQEEAVGVMDVFPGRLVFHRYSLVDGAEYRPYDPWTIPVPHDPSVAPYAPPRRRAASRSPKWPDGASNSATWTDDAAFRGYTVSFPVARHRDETFRYTTELDRFADGRWTRVTVKETLGEFWKLPETTRSPRLAAEFPDVYFSHGERYRFTTRPMDFYGNFGEALVTEAVAPAFDAKWTRVWSAEDPMPLCAFSTHTDWKDRRPATVDAEGFAVLSREHAFVDLPAAAALPVDAPKGSIFRLSYWMDDRHSEGSGWFVAAEDAATGRSLGFHYFATVRGFPGPLRYVSYLAKTKDGAQPIRLGLTYGDHGSRLRLRGMVLERQD